MSGFWDGESDVSVESALYALEHLSTVADRSPHGVYAVATLRAFIEQSVRTVEEAEDSAAEIADDINVLIKNHVSTECRSSELERSKHELRASLARALRLKP